MSFILLNIYTVSIDFVKDVKGQKLTALRVVQVHATSKDEATGRGLRLLKENESDLDTFRISNIVTLEIQ